MFYWFRHILAMNMRLGGRSPLMIFEQFVAKSRFKTNLASEGGPIEE
jgi:hypothetical protein